MSDTYFDSVEANVDGTKQSVPVRDSAAVHTDEIASEFESLAQSQNIDALDTTSKNLVGGINELNSKMQKYVAAISQNVATISVDVNPLGYSNYARFFVLTCSRWNNSDIYTAIGVYRYSTVETQNAARIIASDVSGLSVSVENNGALTANWTNSSSYVQIVAFDLFSDIQE